MFFRLACKSLLNRKNSVLLTLLAVSVSVFVFLGVEHIRYQAKSSFSNTVSGVDLIVGARTGSLNLLLYSVFHIGNATNNIRWETYQNISSDRRVKWSIPISLGDSHKGYRVMGTTTDYFQYFNYGNKEHLKIVKGKVFNELFDVVLGSDVAKKLDYSLGEKIVLAHGVAHTSFSMHDDMPFSVTGILAPTGTPVDQTLYVSLKGIEAIHVGWQQGVKIPGRKVAANNINEESLKPGSITAFMLGLESKITIFRFQRDINSYKGEPLMAILPGMALTSLWQMMSVMENTLRLVSALVLLAALLGLSAMLLASIRERKYEISILRTLGASPWFVFRLILAEAVLITILALLLGSFVLFVCLVLSREYLIDYFGLYVSSNILSHASLELIIFVMLLTVLAAMIPAFSAYISASDSRVK